MQLEAVWNLFLQTGPEGPIPSSLVQPRGAPSPTSLQFKATLTVDDYG
jgi:hypothetical protein